MSSTDDVDELFGSASASSPAPAQPVKPAPGKESRRELRMHVKWAARALLADNTVVPMIVRDISEHGVGLASERAIPQHATLKVAMQVPDVNTLGKFTTVIGSLKTAHMTVSGPDLIYGGTWLSLEGNGTDLIRKWVRKLRP